MGLGFRVLGVRVEGGTAMGRQRHTAREEKETQSNIRYGYIVTFRAIQQERERQKQKATLDTVI